MTDQQRPPIQYAERMFPEPASPGIAQPDRATCSVRHGTSSYQGGSHGEGEEWFHGGGQVGERAVQHIVVHPPTRGIDTQGDVWEPVKIGVLIGAWGTSEPGHHLRRSDRRPS